MTFAGFAQREARSLLREAEEAEKAKEKEMELGGGYPAERQRSGDLSTGLSQEQLDRLTEEGTSAAGGSPLDEELLEIKRQRSNPRLSEIGLTQEELDVLSVVGQTPPKRFRVANDESGAELGESISSPEDTALLLRKFKNAKTRLGIPMKLEDAADEQVLDGLLADRFQSVSEDPAEAGTEENRESEGQHLKQQIIPVAQEQHHEPPQRQASGGISQEELDAMCQGEDESLSPDEESPDKVKESKSLEKELQIYLPGEACLRDLDSPQSTTRRPISPKGGA